MHHQPLLHLWPLMHELLHADHIRLVHVLGLRPALKPQAQPHAHVAPAVLLIQGLQVLKEVHVQDLGHAIIARRCRRAAAAQRQQQWRGGGWAVEDWPDWSSAWCAHARHACRSGA